jgi:hypothetical protein
VSPFRVSIFRDFRTVLCAVSLLSGGYHVRIHYVAKWGQVPFWACRLPFQAISRSAGCRSRHLRTFVDNPVHSHLLGASPLSASSLSPFYPCTPTVDSQSLAVGRCFHSSTWRVGVDEPLNSSSHLHRPTVVKVHTITYEPSRSSPTIWANRSQCVVASERIAERVLGGLASYSSSV